MDAVLRCTSCDAEMAEPTDTGICATCTARTSAGAGGTGASSHPTLKSSPRHEAMPTGSIVDQFPQLDIIETLGQGGMGVVYKARQKGLDRLVALKVLPREAGAEPGFAERFTREGRALAMLSHPNIVNVYDSGESDGLYYFIMEFVDGPNLRDLIVSRDATPDQALNIVAQTCEGLEFAHEEGIVHRDIKPENILLDRKGRVKIADFGVAKLLDRKPSDLALTSPQQVMGTPHYMAPEQTEKPLEVDHRADIYAVGVVFYELLTGELPLGRFPLPSESVGTDARLDEIVLRTLAKDPEGRFQRALDLKTAVQSLTGTQLQQTKFQYVVPTPALATPAPAASSPSAPTIVTPRATDAHQSSLHMEVDFNQAYARVQGSASWMYVLGMFSFIPLGIAAVVLMILLMAGQVNEEVAAPFAVAAVCSFLTVLGAQRMKRLESYRFAQLAAILTLTPFLAVCWVTLMGPIVGIWALMVLQRRDVAAAFEVKKREMKAMKNQMRQAKRGRKPKHP